MKIVPLFKVRNMRAALVHYTEVPDWLHAVPGVPFLQAERVERYETC
jgi:hypothetical protein